MIRATGKMLSKAGLLLAGAAVAGSLTIGREQDTRSEPERPPVAPSQTHTRGSADSIQLELDLLDRRRGRGVTEDLFGGAAVAVAKQTEVAPPAPQPPPPPSAPPLPYVYLGSMTQDGVLKVFLGKGLADYTVKQGDVLEETYRVDRITDTSVEFTYLPLDVRQQLPIVRPR